MTTILLVDDSRVTREVLKVYLIAKDVTLLEAVDGAEALEKALAAPPDLVVADLRMPRVDGCQLSEALRADPRTRGVPVVILTSTADPETVQRCLAAGAREVLRKPIQPRQLLGAVNHHLALARSPSRP